MIFYQLGIRNRTCLREESQRLCVVALAFKGNEIEELQIMRQNVQMDCPKAN